LNSYEVVGTLFGLWSVILTVRQHIGCWPAGIVSVSAYAVLFYQVRLYADMALQVFFIGTSLYGWYAWKRGGVGRTALPIRTLTWRGRFLWIVVLTPVIWAASTALRRYTDASLPVWDTTASTLSVAAQLLLMRKIFENWVLWIAVDVLSIGIYVVKEVFLTAGLYAVFFGLATAGFFAWRRDLRAVR